MDDNDDWEVGARVQNENYNEETAQSTFMGGEIIALRKDKREMQSYHWRPNRTTEYQEYVAGATVRWDDGTEEDLEAYDLQREDNEFEREFRSLVPEVQEKIKQKLKLAEKYLDEAVAISEEYGVPFESNISFLSQGYVPGSFSSKHSEVDRELMKSLCDVFNEYDGWQHSAVC